MAPPVDGVGTGPRASANARSPSGRTLARVASGASSGRITQFRFLRLAFLADRHVLLQSVAVTVENYSGRIELVAGLTLPDGRGERRPLTVTRDLATVMVVAPETSVAMATGSAVQPKAEATKSRQRHPTDHVDERWSWEAGLGETVCLDRVVAVYTSRDVADPADTTRAHSAMSQEQGVPALARDHVDAWSRRWDAAEVQIVGDDEAQRALRFAAYHLLAAANPEDERVSIGARGLTGESYKGHVFWDTEIYMLPFYLHRPAGGARAADVPLPHARRRPAEGQADGYRGALYAWESADTGEETTPRAVIAPDGEVIPILSGEQEHHISADVAYAVWQYWRATGGRRLPASRPARRCSSRPRASGPAAARMEADGRFHIRDVIGPDEYHEAVDDNAYHQRHGALEPRARREAAAPARAGAAQRLERLSARLALTSEELGELARGRRRDRTRASTPRPGSSSSSAATSGSRRSTSPSLRAAHGADGHAPRPRADPAARRSSSRPTSWCCCALLWDAFAAGVREANFRYYEPRTATAAR